MRLPLEEDEFRSKIFVNRLDVWGNGLGSIAPKKGQPFGRPKVSRMGSRANNLGSSSVPSTPKHYTPPTPGFTDTSKQQFDTKPQTSDLDRFLLGSTIRPSTSPGQNFGLFSPLVDRSQAGGAANNLTGAALFKMPVPEYVTRAMLTIRPKTQESGGKGRLVKRKQRMVPAL